MTTLFHSLSQRSEEYDCLREMYRSIFLDGECYPFAIALSQGLGWPLVGLMQGEIVRHAGVRAADGKIRDIRGSLTEEEFRGTFGNSQSDIRTITTDDLYAIRPVNEYTIIRARQHAEVIWPELPWIETYAMKVKAFADELEILSRKHGFWITAGVPADPPRLYSSCGEEIGYRVRTAVDGTTFTITRYLPIELRFEEE